MGVHLYWVSDKGENLTCKADEVKRIYSNDGDPNGALVIELNDTNICVLTKHNSIRFELKLQDK